MSLILPKVFTACREDGTTLSDIATISITDELERRPPKKTDYLQEKLALQDLAARMVDQPEEVLPDLSISRWR